MTSWTRLVPRVLLVVAVALCAFAAVWHLSRAADPVQALAGVLTCAYLAWFLAETPITYRKLAQPPAEERTLVPYALVRVGTAVSAVLGPLPWRAWSWWLLLPALVFAAGVALRLTAIRVLGRFYSHHVVRYDDHTIVTSGPYRPVRHPAYAGMALAHAGFVAFFLNPVSVVLAVALVGVLAWRIRVEERTLWTVPGYRAYALGRARLLPGVW